MSEKAQAIGVILTQSDTVRAAIVAGLAVLEKTHGLPVRKPVAVAPRDARDRPPGKPAEALTSPADTRSPPAGTSVRRASRQGSRSIPKRESCPGGSLFGFHVSKSSCPVGSPLGSTAGAGAAGGEQARETGELPAGLPGERRRLQPAGTPAGQRARRPYRTTRALRRHRQRDRHRRCRRALRKSRLDKLRDRPGMIRDASSHRRSHVLPESAVLATKLYAKIPSAMPACVP